MQQIGLTQGRVALVDDEDYEGLSKWKWHVRKGRKTYYAARTIRFKNDKYAVILMHREILNTPPGMETDHKDGDGLNNCRNNLRIATSAQNKANRRKTPGTSKFKGVCWHIDGKRKKRWVSRIMTNYRMISLGHYSSEIEAARAYDLAAQKYFGEFAHTNF